MPKRLLTLLFLLVLLFPSVAPVSAAQGMPATSSQSSPASSVMFIENVGQFADDARFQVWGGPAGEVWLAEDAIWLTVVEPRPEEAMRSLVDPQERFDPLLANIEQESAPRKAANIKLSFVGADPHPRIEPFDRLDTVVSYFIGNEPDKWRPDVPVWGGVRYVDLYPGVDLEITSEGGRMAQRLAARPGADLDAVRLRVEGVDVLTVVGDTLRLTTAAGEVVVPLLLTDGSNGDAAVQPRGVHTFDVAAPFVSANSNPVSRDAGGRQSKIENRQSPADNPADLLYGTFLGGDGFDYGYSITVDGLGNAYVTGVTDSSGFPTTPGAFDTSHSGGTMDIFVAKLNPTGTGLAYATFLGDAVGRQYFSSEPENSIAVDSMGSAYITGLASSDFPTTPNSFNATCWWGSVFVVKLNPAGSSLAYSTCLGGGGARGIAIDKSGYAYVAGVTSSTDFPTTPGAFDTIHEGGTCGSPMWGSQPCTDAFMVKLNPSGSGLVYATFLGGQADDAVNAIAVDASGNTYVTGGTESRDFPTTTGAFDNSHNGGNNFQWLDAFVVKLNSTGNQLVYGSFLGGRGVELGHSIAVDETGNAYIAGNTESSDFPTTPGAFDTSRSVFTDAFVVKVNSDGSGLMYATFLEEGGNSVGSREGIALNRTGSAYVTGKTNIPTFPTTAGAFDTGYNGSGSWGDDIFVVKLNPTGSGLDYATFLGGRDFDYGPAIAVDGAGRAYVTGVTSSRDFPTTPRAFDSSYNGTGGTYPAGDAFVVKLAMGPPLPFDAAELAAQAEYPTVAPGGSVNFWINVRNTGTTTWRASDGYGWRGDDEWLGDSGPVTGETPPGGVWRRETTFTAPTTPGEYVYGFMLRHGTQEFGPYFFVRVTVRRPEWTLMFYLAGDNNQGDEFNQTRRVLESARLRSTSLTNVVAAYDGEVRGDSLYYAYTSRQSAQIEKGELNMGNPQTLADFINWAKTTYPAEHYALIIVDHGTGISGVAEDKQFGWPVEEWLTPKDLRNAIPSKVDVIVMRACLMGMIEVAHEFQGKADFYVASQTTQHGDAFGAQEFGAVIPKITDATTPRQLAQIFLDEYKQLFLGKQSGTVSILSMSELPNLVDKVQTLGQALREQMTTEKAVLNTVRQSVQRIDMDANGVNDSADEYIDLRDFAKLVEQKTAQPTVASAAAAVKYAVDQVVKDHYQRGGPWKGYVGDTLVNNTTYYTNTNGISIFFPSQPRSFLKETWSSWATGVTSWLPQAQSTTAQIGEVAEAANPWMQLLINYTTTINPVDNPNPPELLPVYATGRLQRLYLPLIRR